MRAHLFPGQGAQHRGMGRGLFEAFPELGEQASSTLGYCVRTLCIDDPEEQLADTRFTQPAVFVVNAMEHLRALDEDGGAPDYYAGHSLGEYNALWAAGVLSFEAALELVRERGAIMAEEVEGTMGVVLGWTHSSLREFVEQGGYDIEIANLNGPHQQVVAGTLKSINRFEAALSCVGQRWIRLDVTGPFHSRLMDSAMLRFCPVLRRVTFNAIRVPVMSNVTARPHIVGDIPATMAAQINHPVLWHETMNELIERGVRNFVQTGPGDALTNLAAQAVEMADKRREST